MEIKVENYLSEDEIKEIVKESVKDRMSRIIDNEDDLHRILLNHAYRYIYIEIEKLIPKHNKLIASNVKKVLEKESSYEYNIFRSKNSYGNAENSKATAILLDEVGRLEQTIRDNVLNTVKGWNYDKDVSSKIASVTDNLCGNIYNLTEALTTTKGE